MQVKSTLLAGLCFALAATAADAAPLAGQFNISGNMGISSTSITWSDTAGVDQAVASGGTQSFVGVSSVDIGNLNFPTDPVGSAGFPDQTFLTFPSDPAFPTLQINKILSGVNGSANCSAAPAAGQLCTPTGSAFNFVNNPGGAITSTLTFEVSGMTSDSASTFTAFFTSQFTEPFQDVLGGEAASGAIGNSYSASIVVTPNAITSVPEPLTLSLFGAGLTGAAAMRKRKSK